MFQAEAQAIRAELKIGPLKTMEDMGDHVRNLSMFQKFVAALDVAYEKGYFQEEFLNKIRNTAFGMFENFKISSLIGVLKKVMISAFGPAAGAVVEAGVQAKQVSEGGVEGLCGAVSQNIISIISKSAQYGAIDAGVACQALKKINVYGTVLDFVITAGVQAYAIVQDLKVTTYQSELTNPARTIAQAASTMLFKVVDVVFAALKNFCFTGDMEVLTRRGWVRWDELQAGDEVASRHEDIPEGAIEYRPVQVVWELKAPIWHVHVGGEVVRTTGEHPFYVLGEGWVPARALRPGDTLLSHDGQRVSVEEVFPTGLEEPVYNAMIADFHTYFVSKSHWSFSVWAHNAGCKQKNVQDAAGAGKLKDGEARHAAGLINKGKVDDTKAYLRSKGIDPESAEVQKLFKDHGERTVLSQPGGLKSTEGQQVRRPNGTLATTHPLTKHGPDATISFLQSRVQDELVDKGKIGIRTRFDNRAVMETAIFNVKQSNATGISNWLQTNPPAGATQSFTGNPNMGNRNLGTGYEVTTVGGPIQHYKGSLTNVTLVLIANGRGGYLIHTAHPVK